MTTPVEHGSTCSVCGRLLEPGALGERCPRCLLKAGIESSSSTVAPTRQVGSELETPLDRGRFVAGTVLSERYRIIGLLGRGGMGEVYKAEDLKLRQLVALKFLPDALSNDGSMLARFHHEARAARQITHQNVCRVHDIGEAQVGSRSMHYLSMEYIDGEDLNALLRRIGHLPARKGVELARQVCAGLAAAHDAGMVHRDLKPANIMVDGRGRARITDFGLSGLADEIRGDEASGTPAYMAPEQLRGSPATAASDIYALGLVLYEVFSGRRPFEGRNIADLVAQQERGAVPLAQVAPEVGFQVERAVTHCLSSRAADRPRSAHDVAASLLSGDPLSAAIAAGETPSPEMVAAAGSREGFRPSVAWALLLSIVAILFAAGTFLNPARPAKLALQTPPEGFAHRAREMLARLGHPDPPADFAYGFEREQNFVAWRARNQPFDTDSHEWIRFWYRESPAPLVPSASPHGIGPLFAAPESRISSKDPPLLTPGMLSLSLDAQGRLLEFDSVPTTGGNSAGNVSVDTAALLEMAGLSTHSLQAVEPGGTPPAGSVSVLAWKGVWPGRPDIPLHVEAVVDDGRLLRFAMVGPWLEPDDSLIPNAGSRGLIAVTFALVVFLTLGSPILAWRNIRTGRGDRRGAFRLSLFAFVIILLAWFIGSDHRIHRAELSLYLSALAESLYWSVLAGLLYLAVEPFVRRRWPHALIAWNRVLEGRWSDPLAGREVLAGFFFASVVCIAKVGSILLGMTPRQLPEPDVLQAIHSHADAAAFLLRTLFDSANIALALFFLLSFFRAVLGNKWVAMAAWMVLINVLTNLEDIQLWGVMVISLFGILWLMAVMRFGLLAGMAMWFADRILRAEIMLAPQMWYAGRLYLLLGVLIALVIYAFRTSVGDQPIMTLDAADARD